jgi:hypothetical protein
VPAKHYSKTKGVDTAEYPDTQEGPQTKDAIETAIMALQALVGRRHLRKIVEARNTEQCEDQEYGHVT